VKKELAIGSEVLDLMDQTRNKTIFRLTNEIGPNTSPSASPLTKTYNLSKFCIGSTIGRDILPSVMCSRMETPLQILSQRELQDIHGASLQILESVGIGVDNAQILELLRKNGCQVDEGRCVAKIPEELITSSLDNRAKTVVYGSRSSAQIEVGSGNLAILSSPDNMYMLDLETGTRRPGTLHDCAMMARLIDALDYFHICCVPVVPKEPPPRLRSLYAMAEVIRNTEKHCLVCPGDGVEAEYCVEIAGVVAGGRDELVANPVISTVICPSSPLRFPANSLDLLSIFSRNALPIVIIPAPLAGVGSPVTMAGTLAVANAEALAGVAMIHILNEGSPVVYGGSSIPFDMRYGIPAHGAVEYGLFSAIAAQLARLYGLPSYAGGAACNANLFDAQAGYEKMCTLVLPFLGGIDMVVDAGLNANSLISYDEPIIQNEISAMVTRISKGFQVNQQTLALDVVAKVAIGGSFLGEKHTRDHAWTDFRYPLLGNRASYERWVEEGAKEMRSRAIEKAKDILVKHEPTRIRPEINKEIDEILTRASNRLQVG